MFKIEKIKSQPEATFRKAKPQEHSGPVPSELSVLEYFCFVKEFLKASEIIQKEEPNLFVQKLHLAAQSMELAMKAGILTCAEEPKPIHDVVKLTEKLEDHGFSFTQTHLSTIVLLNHYFFQDLFTSTKFKSRYSTKEQESPGGPMPEFTVIQDLFYSLVAQANERCKRIELLIYKAT